MFLGHVRARDLEEAAPFHPPPPAGVVAMKGHSAARGKAPRQRGIRKECSSLVSCYPLIPNQCLSLSEPKGEGKAKGVVMLSRGVRLPGPRAGKGVGLG